MKLENKQIGVLVALILAVIMLFLPGYSSDKYTFDPELLAQSIVEKEDQITPQQLSEMIIEGTEKYSLIDIREASDFTGGNIKSSVNIPVKKLLLKSTINLELSDTGTVILYSNGDSHAHQAWLILKAAGKDVLVLEGGYNGWVSAILNPSLKAGATDDEVLKYKMTAAVGNNLSGNLKVNGTKPAEKSNSVLPKVKRKIGKKKLQGCG